MANSKAKGAAKNVNRKVSFVTGANGKLGKALITELVKRGEEVRALIKSKEMILELPQGVFPYVGDLSDKNVLESACDGAHSVFHLAATVSERGITQDILRVNVDGTRNVLDACVKGKVKRIVYSSSVDVYGIKRKDVLSEESALGPQDRYGYSKMLAERQIIEHKPRVPFTILRFSTIYGKGFEHTFFKVLNALKSGKVLIIGKGNNSLTLLNVNDAVQAMILASNSESAKNEIFNISDGNVYSQEQIMGIASDMLGVPRPTMHLNEIIVKVIAKRRGMNTDELRYLVSNRNIDISKARTVLGYKPKVDIETGARELVDQFLKMSIPNDRRKGPRA